MFDTLLSNKGLKEQIGSMLKDNRPLHAFLFCGAKGSGKKTAARELAKALVGNNAHKADRGSHPDIITVAPDPNKKLIPVDKIREMRADAFINPSEGIRKIYIIDGAHLLNDAGQNALLTILEQPPSFAVFILLSENKGKILPTVISRCAVFEMEYVEAQEGAKFLQARYPDIPYARLLASMNASGGNIGLAQNLATGEEFDKNAVMCTKLLKCVSRGDGYGAASILCSFSKDECASFLPLLAMYIKDIIVYRLTGIDTRLVFKTGILQNKADFDKININTLYNSVHACETAQEQIAGNIGISLITSALTVQLFGGKQIG